MRSLDYFGEMMPSQDFLKFQQNLKKTSLGVRFGKKLFSDPHSLSPKDVTTIMRMLGLNVPRGAVIAQDLAQVITSGSTLVDSYNSYDELRTAENLNSLVDCSADSAALGARMFQELGWMDSGTATNIMVGSTILRLIASGGADVTAWISLALSIQSAGEGAIAMAGAQAAKGASAYVKQIIDKDSANIASNLMELQKGKIGIFGFLAKSASNSGSVFDQAIIKNENFLKMFPGLHFLPVFQDSVTFKGWSKTWWGETKTSYSTQYWSTIGDFNNEDEARQYIFHQVLEPYIFGYLQMPKRIWSAAILCQVANQRRLDFEMTPLFLKQKLLPIDIGDAEVIANMGETLPNPGIIIGGKPIYFDQPISKDQAVELEKKGKGSELFKSSKISKIITDAYTFEGFNTLRGQSNEQFYYSEVANLIACLDYLDLVRNDPAYAGRVLPEMEAYKNFQTLDSWKKQVQEANMVSMVRKVNATSLHNVAYFLGVPASKLKNTNDFQKGSLAKF